MKRLFISIGLLFFVSPLWGEGELNPVTTAGTTRREGDDRVPLALRIGSTSSVSPYANIDWGDGKIGQKSNFRAITIQNTSPYDILCSTYSQFVGNGPRWVIPQSTGSFTSYNYATFYMIMGADVSSQTISGVIERKKN